MRSARSHLGPGVTRAMVTIGVVAATMAVSTPAAEAISAGQVSTGSVHSCVRTRGGDALCWGENGTGMLGDGTTEDRRMPVAVAGLAGRVTDVQAAWDHSCAVTTGGAVLCWGHNGDGELGDGTFESRRKPVVVSGLSSGYRQVVLGFDSGCALSSVGGVRCWGYNGNGQLGDGTRNTRFDPVEVSGLSSGVRSISAGWDHTCAVTTAGGVLCWGQNDHGELGDGTRTDRVRPIGVVGLSSGVAAVSAGFDQTCALLDDGAVRCWGQNATGEVGDGTTMLRTHPVDVLGLAGGVASISAGYDHTCAVTVQGGALCWGNNASGELGDGTAVDRSRPIAVYGWERGVAQISAGGWKHAGLTCLRTTFGAVECFGANHAVSGLEPIASGGGQIGDGTKMDRYTPVAVRRLNGHLTPYRLGVLISRIASSTLQGFRS